MDEAEENLRALIQKLLKEELTGRMQARMDELLKMKDYDVFISYRSKYQREGDGVEITRKLEEFLEKQTYFVNKEEQRPYEVFRDESRMAGETGEFTPTLKWKIRNSEYFLLVLGPKAFHHPFEKRDVFYQEILTALDRIMR